MARSLGIDTRILGKWIRQYNNEVQGFSPTGKALTSEQQHIQ
ncbi:hypothetical protein [Xenorhabdus bovienii]